MNRKFVSLASILGLAILLGACGPATETPLPPNAATPETSPTVTPTESPAATPSP